MADRIFSIAMNTYREAARARVLLGLLALALATSAYSIVIATMSIRQEMRIVADIGAASLSLYGVSAAVILGATSLYRELELKTVFPILTRRLERHEYWIGKYLGIVATLVAFLALDGASVLFILALQAQKSSALVSAVALAMVLALALALWRLRLSRVFVLLPWSIAMLAAMALLAHGAGGERQLVCASVLLSLAEVMIVTAVTMVFSSFSSPFLTAVFALMLFAIGRSTDTLGNLPEKVFGGVVRTAGIVLAKVIPNLAIYVPARPLLLGEVVSIDLTAYVARAWINAVLYVIVLSALGSAVFRRRDFE